MSKARRRTASTFLALAFLLCGDALTTPRATSPSEDRGRQQVGPPLRREAGSRLWESYAALPIAFEPNHGQAGMHVRFAGRGAGYGIFLGERDATLVVRGPARDNGASTASVKMTFAGATGPTRVDGRDALQGRSHYLRSDRRIVDVPTYARVAYAELYPGIDLVYYGNQREIEYDFIVRPGADPSAIQVTFEGIRALEINASGEVVLRTAAGNLLQRAPAMYQDIDGVRQMVAGRAVARGADTIGFEMGPYDPAHSLVIDPILHYSTYLGGGGFDDARAIAVDTFGNAYVTGSTLSMNFPQTAGIVQPIKAGGADAFVTKLNLAGNGLVYSTYFGGGQDDHGTAIAIDASGNAYVAGYTLSTNFPVTVGAFGEVSGGQTDGFLAKLSANGTTLLYGTYVGGGGDDWAHGVAVDTSGNAYVVGATTSAGPLPLPTTVGAVSETHNGGIDAFVVKVNPTAPINLVYATFLGGSGDDRALGVTVDALNNAHVTGGTASPDFPSLNAIQAHGGSADAFVTKLNDTGTTLVYSTFLGGAADDEARAIGKDAAGNIYIAGATASDNFPTLQALQAIRVGDPAAGTDAFVAKLNPSGVLVYSTYLGGSQDDAANGIAVNAGGEAHIAGVTASADFPVSGSLQSFNRGAGTGTDAFAVKLDGPGTSLLYSTYLGGGNADSARAIAADASGAYVAGGAGSGFPTVNAFQAANTLGGDAFVAKLVLSAGSLEFDADVYVVAENELATVTVRRTGSTDGTVTVDFQTSDSTATAGLDYTAASGTLTFVNGEASKTFSVPIASDTTTEVNESIVLTLSHPSGGATLGAQSTALLELTDAEPAVEDPIKYQVNIDDVSVLEGTGGSPTSLTFSVTISPTLEANETVSVDAITADGSGGAGDFIAIASPQTLTFNSNVSTQNVTVQVTADTLDESDETFFVSLTNLIAVGLPPEFSATLGDDIGVGTIIDDDATPTVSVAGATVTEGDAGTVDAQFTVSLSTPSAQTVTVNFATFAGVALAGVDYTTTAGVLTFAPGVTTQTILVPVVGDLVFESATDETFSVMLSGASGASISDDTAIGAITDNDPQPTLSLGPASVPEPDTGSVTVSFAVTLSHPSGQTVTVDFDSANGTATAGADYTSTSGTLTFSPGVTTQTVMVPVAGDVNTEANETFTVTLSNPGNATIGAGSGTGTIVDNDLTLSLSIQDVSGAEDLAGGMVSFTVTLSNPTSTDVTVSYTTVDGTAQAGTDYTATAGTLTFTAGGSATQTIQVPVINDGLDEADETFTVQLATAPGGGVTLADDTGVGAIIDDDATPTVSVADANVTEGDAGTVNAQFTVTLSTPSAQTVTVNFATFAGVALAGVDYTTTAGVLTFAPGVTTQTILVPVVGDLVFESATDETFSVMLSGVSGVSISDDTAIGAITDNDTQPTLSLGQASVPEPDTGSVTATFAVTLSHPSVQTVTVDFETANNTATAGADYTSTSGTLTFSPGVTTQTVMVPVAGDVHTEANETFTVTLSNPSNATIGAGSGTGTIVDNDGDAGGNLPTVSISATQAPVAEGESVAFTATLSAASTETVTVNFVTADGTAKVGSDYLPAGGTVTFAPGDTAQTIHVSTVNDAVAENSETLLVTLTNAVNATVGTGQATGMIDDTDGDSTLTITNASVIEGNTGSVNAVFTVSLSAVSGKVVTLDYSSADGTATSAADYATAAGMLTFSPGETTKTIVAAVNGDTAGEGTETFFVNLSNAANAAIANAQGVGTIVNDDVPTVSISDAAAVAEGATAAFTVTLSPASSETVTVDFVTADGTATVASGDYTGTSGKLTFAAGETQQTIAVSVSADVFDEPNEFLTVTLMNPAGATTGEASGAVIVTDDDAMPAVSINASTAVTEGHTGTTAAIFTASLSNPSQSTITVNFSTADGTALAGVDYATATAGTLTFAPGDTSKTIIILVNGDQLDEPDESFTVTLTGSTNATVAAGTSVGSITDDDAMPTISITDVSITESDTGGVSAVFNVTLSNAGQGMTTVDFSTSDVTATAGSDYAANSGTLTFAPGETAKTVVVQVIGDTGSEPNETMRVTLANPQSATIGDGEAIGTILNDDGLPSVGASGASVGEGAGSVAFTVSLSAPSNQAVTVNFSTVDGTAVGGRDYVASTGTATLAAGQMTTLVIVSVTGDQFDENDESFSLQLATPSGATLAGGNAVATIVDDDAPPTVGITASVVVTEGHSGSTPAVFTVALSGASETTVGINFGTADGTARAGIDYGTTSGNLAFAPGEVTKTVAVTITGDTVDEIDETFTLQLTAPTNATIAAGLGTATITDDDAAPTISIGNVSVGEADTGSVDAVFTLHLSSPAAQAVTVDFSTGAGTASAGTDFTAASGTVTFVPGETTKTIQIAVLGDALTEPNETFQTALVNASGAVIGAGTGVATILDNDAFAAPPPGSGPISVSISDAQVSETDSGTVNAVFTVTLTGQVSAPLSVSFSTVDDTALASDGDFVANSGSVVFVPGADTQTITVVINGDTVSEESESFFVNLSAPIGINVTKEVAVGRISDNDAAPSLSIADGMVDEGDDGTTDMLFTVTLSNPASTTVSVNYSTADGTAEARRDYSSGSGVIVFAPGSTTQTVIVSVTGERRREPDETFVVTLSGATGATISDNSATGVIVNDDGRSPLIVSQSASPSPAMAGQNLTFTIGVTNGGASASRATVTDTLPAGVRFVSAQSTRGGCGRSGRRVTCDLGTLGAAASATITIVVQPPPGSGALTNEVKADAPGSDPVESVLVTPAA